MVPRGWRACARSHDISVWQRNVLRAKDGSRGCPASPVRRPSQTSKKIGFLGYIDEMHSITVHECKYCENALRPCCRATPLNYRSPLRFVGGDVTQGRYIKEKEKGERGWIDGASSLARGEAFVSRDVSCCPQYGTALFLSPSQIWEELDLFVGLISGSTLC